MRYRVLGRTGLYVSRICFGTMTFGSDPGFWGQIGTLGVDEAAEQLARSFDRGVNFVDTANVYHFGNTEEVIGAALKRVGRPRERVVLATKVLMKMGGDDPNGLGLSRHHILNELDNSLRRLQVEHIDLYQIHGFDPITPLDETLEALDTAVRSGKVRTLGLCNLAAWQIMKSLAISERKGLARFESVQAYYSVAGRDLEREVVPLCRDQSLAVLPWSPLAGGLLSGKFDRDGKGPDGARRTNFDFPPVDRDRAFNTVDVMRPIAERHGCSVARVALAWLLTRDFVTSVIIGTKTMEQLDDNLDADALADQLTSDEIQAIDEVSQLPPEYPGWMLERQGGARLAQFDS